MDCACTVEMDIDDYCEVLSNRFIKARKMHSCNECNRIIHPPDEYFREVTKYDGAMSVHKTCTDIATH